MEVAVGAQGQDVIGEYLAAQVGTITGSQDDVRTDAPDAVHQMRVAARRVRTTLRVFGRLLRRDLTDPVREVLRWLAGELGPVRDAEVVRERVLTTLGDLPEEQFHGPVEQRRRTEFDDEYEAARGRLLIAMGSPRHTALQTLLGEQIP